MNIVYIKDFTTPLKADSSLKVDESVNEEDKFLAVDKNGHGTFVAGIIGS